MAGGYAARALIDRDRSPREIAAERPRVLLKADDYGVGSGRPVAPGWLAFTDYIATHDLKANIGLNEKTRTVWSNLPTGIAMQVGATERK